LFYRAFDLPGGGDDLANVKDSILNLRALIGK
jgi:hypothetical protein